MLAATFTESATAWGTLVLAVGTVGLAFFTYRLARNAGAERRSEWRPVLIAASKQIDVSVPGEIGIEVRNVGRGPALGVRGELRLAGPAGATPPGEEDTCLPGAIMELRLTLKEPTSPGAVHRFEVTYYDIAEWWHVSQLTGVGRRRGDDPPELEIASSFARELDRRVGIFGSREAAKFEAKQRSPLYRRWPRA